MMMWRIGMILLVCLPGWTVQVLAAESFSASVKKIIDGDSMLVESARGTTEVRLYGVDCPEYDQPFSREAKVFAAKKVLGKKVMVEPLDQDSYGRTVALVTRGDDVLNEELVEAGLAWVYPRYCKRAFCSSWEKDQRSARGDKIGLWQENHPQSPWQWKRSKRSRAR